ncbi:MAG: TonB-dependent receptor plug domain-containing protein [Flavobacteriaceae bacterium]|nr:TonB-dependent receptor plug domain-containing protein [Flavobacteriaceae bacterium]
MRKYLSLLIAISICLSVSSQEITKKVTLLWDTSYSMIDRNLDNDLDYLNEYFFKNSNTEVTLIKFSNDIILTETYGIKNSNWLDLKKELQNTTYDGSTNYNKLTVSASDEVLLFSDGYTYDSKLLKITSPLTVVSSNKEYNADFLVSISKGAKDKFIDLRAIQSDKSLTSEFKTINGRVSDENGYLSDVTVISRGNNTQTLTDSLGNFSIEAQNRGILEFRYIGKNTILLRGSDSATKNIYMTDGNMVLDEVVLENNKKEEIDNGYGKLDKKRLGYSIETLDGDKIIPSNTDIKDAVAGKFAGIKIGNNDDLTQFVGRGRYTTILGNQYGLVVIDGLVTQQSDSSRDNGFIADTGFIDPANIESVTYLKGLAATNIYGSDGSNGVLLIKTKTGTSSYKKKKKKQLGNTPTYIDDTEIEEIIDKPYIREISQTTTIEEAYKTYLSQRELYGKDVNFFFDMASYFKNWNNSYMIKRILSNVLEVQKSLDVEILRMLAYKYEEFDMFDESVEAYEQIISIKPSESQAYRNLALSYQLNKQFTKAQEVHNKIYNNKYTEVNSFSGLKQTINSEYKNLVALHNSTLVAADIPDFYKKNTEYDTRIVFEWSYFDAQFDLQIVNPQQRYYTWSHTQNEERSRIIKETAQGYGLEEFFITKKDKGEWLFNITYYGKKTGDNSIPTYLKITVYNNFGRPNQTKKVTVKALNDLNKKESILKLKI